MSGTQIVPNPTFNEIPSPLYRPGSYMEVRPNFANIGILPFPARNLIVGQRLAAVTGSWGVVIPDITRPAQATQIFGAGSMGEAMVFAYLNSGCQIPLDVIAIPDAGAATAATLLLAVTGTWSVAGTLRLLFGGRRYSLGVAAADTPATVAAAVAALVNADTQSPFSAVVGASPNNNQITLTAKNLGAAGNDLQAIIESVTEVPGSLAMDSSVPQAGATNPTVNLSGLIGGSWYTGVAIAWQDTANLQAMAAELTRRFTATVREDCIAYTCLTGTYSQALAAIPNINSQFIAALPMTQPGSPPWVVSASLLGVASQKLMEDPSLQLADLALPGIIGPQRTNLLDDTEQELMLAGKGSTFNVLRDGTVTLQRVVSTYTSNAQGIADSTTWFDIMETAVASRIRYDWRNYFKLLYPSNKLAPDGSLAAEYNTNVCTPRRAGASWTARLMAYAKAGWVMNETTDARAAIFKIDPNDPNRLDYQVQYTRIGNLIVDAGVLMFAAS